MSKTWQFVQLQSGIKVYENAPTPKGEGWSKYPSVTTGGKAFFWARRHNGQRQWFVWNRAEKCWEYQIDA